MAAAPDATTRQLLGWLRASGVRVSSLATDSRAVAPGDVFLAYPGIRNDARAFIGDAVARGAAAVLWERDGFQWNPAWTVPQRAVDGLRSLSGWLAAEVYGHPSRTLWTMGVTGTNGKTSCSHWIAQACGLCGARTAVVGTLGIGVPAAPGSDAARLAPNPNTTPEAVTLHRAFAQLLEQGVQGVAMEVSSIGLEQERTNGVEFGAALFTNLSRDHLDYHGDMERYARAKQMLFRVPTLKHAILNLDDVQGVHIARDLHGSGVNRVGYSAFAGVAARSGLECYVEAHELRVGPEGVAFDVKTSWGDARIESALLGRFNVSNLLGVLGTMLASGVPFVQATSALARLQPIVGRMQRLGGNGRPLVVVDYAHTPDALEKTLSALSDVARASGGELTVVFGCGGERDKGKRPLMGAVASRYADRVVLTSDNPRSEQPEAILADIMSGLTIECEALPDRREALAAAIGAAREEDVVLVAGKGHETYQEIAGKRLPYSDVDEVGVVLEKWTT